MRVVCAWCGCELRDGSEPVSHGICPSCFGRLKATLGVTHREAQPPSNITALPEPEVRLRA